MADVSDVLNAIYNNVVSAVYPNGTSNPSVAGVDVTIIQGWPIKNKLDDAMKSGKAMVSIYPTNKNKDITKFERVYKTSDITAPTILISISNLTITFSGLVSVPQSIIITVDGANYQYTVLISDTLSSIASHIADLIPGATAVGTTITLLSAYRVTGNIATQATASLDLGREEQEFLIACWCPTFSIRNLLAPPIDEYMRVNYQFPVSTDNFNIMIFYEKTEWIDKMQVPLVYRRDLYYKVQYSVTQSSNFTTVASTVTETSLTLGGY